MPLALYQVEILDNDLVVTYPHFSELPDQTGDHRRWPAQKNIFITHSALNMTIDVICRNEPLTNILIQFIMVTTFLESREAVKMAEDDFIPDVVVKAGLILRWYQIKKCDSRALPIPADLGCSASTDVSVPGGICRSPECSATCHMPRKGVMPMPPPMKTQSRSVVRKRSQK